ncbi:MAG: murC [Candidatus Saccharibacteria bacterium]|nr:murC [Candidatus Saccharibacteria bacterium]
MSMNIYFSGVGGVGIGPLVHIALDAGYTVQGSDANESPLTRELRSRGVSVSIGQDGTFLKACHAQQPIDWYVYTAALPADHPELLLAHELGIKTAKRDELLARIIKEKNLKLIAVAGSHGKTTTTGMLVWAFKQLGVPISYSIGTTLSFGPSGKFDPNSEYFVYECDEFDRNFLHFSPHVALITSVDYDHPDTYSTEADYLDAFRQFASQCQKVILWQKDNRGLDVTADSGWVLDENEVLDIALPGIHNRRNATLAVKAFEYLKLASNEQIISILAQFPGTNRRFEQLGNNLYSDYGHHPVEIAATLQHAREISDHVVLVYQPHQNVRQHEVREQYTDSFTLAERVYWLPTYLSREDPHLSILSPEELTKDITNKDAVHIAELNDKLWSNIQEARNEGKLVLCMGAGTIDKWVRDQLTA